MEDYGYRNQVVDNYPEPVSQKEWLITLLIMCVPLVNLVMPFVWAFGGGANPSKANFFKAQIIIVSILLGLGVFFALAQAI